MAKAMTSKEQSEKLLELGIDLSTSDLSDDDFPAWSLGALIEMLPDSISSGYTNIKGHTVRYWLESDLKTEIKYITDDEEYLLPKGTPKYLYSKSTITDDVSCFFDLVFDTLMWVFNEKCIEI